MHVYIESVSIVPCRDQGFHRSLKDLKDFKEKTPEIATNLFITSNSPHCFCSKKVTFS